MKISELQQVWEDWAKADPLWAILSDPTKAGRRWDTDEFFLSGRQEIEAALAELETRSIPVRRGRCLDFGCGVGRLTQALAQHFEAATGVDISPTMIREAHEMNKYPDTCIYRVNGRSDLSLFPSGSFDFIYSNIVLQHIAPEISENYIREFVRLLSEGGVAMFQIPAGFTVPNSTQGLPEASHEAELKLHGEPLPAVPGVSQRLLVEVKNASEFGWAADCKLQLGNHWRSADGSSLVTQDDGRSPVLKSLEPGEQALLQIEVEAPAMPGDYMLEFDMVEEGVCWFADRGSKTLRLPVRVTHPSRLRQLADQRARRKAGGAPTKPRPYEMHGVPKERVLALIEESGGRILDVAEYNACGDGWESYRYFATPADPTPASS